MTSQTTSDPSGSNDGLWLAAAGALLAAMWHTAIVVATPGHDWANFRGTIMAIVEGDPFLIDGEHATTMGLFWVVAIAETAVLVTGLVLWFTRNSGGGASEGLATAKQLRDTVGKVHSVRAPFAKLNGKPVTARDEDMMVIIAPPGMGKTTHLVIPILVDSTGPAVVTSTKVDVLHLTHDHRAAMTSPDGTPARIHVFDPAGVSAWPNKATWDIVAGCSDQLEASARATAMVNAAPLGNARNIDFFEQAASMVLAALLRAAALGDKTIYDVCRWARDFSDEEPYVILREKTSDRDETHKTLAKFCRSDARETVDSTAMTLALVLKPIIEGSAEEAVMPSEEGFDIERFLDSNDTIYLMSETGGEDSVAPLVTALVAAITRAAQKRSQRLPGGRLERPLLLMLDEVANIAPIPNLPAVMSDARSRGITVCAVFQSRAQLDSKWGEGDGAIIFNAAAVKILLGGLSEAAFLDELSQLAGTREVARTTTQHGRSGGSSVSMHKERIIELADISKLDESWAFLKYRNRTPALVRLTPWWKRKDSKRFEQSERGALEREGLIAP